MKKREVFLLSVVLAFWVLACGLPSVSWQGEEKEPGAAVPPPPTVEVVAGETSAPAPGDKWELWTGGTQLRGADIWQRRVYPELDGEEFMGPGPVGPPYVQDDLDRLAALGANYVNVSHPGLFTEKPPYGPDEQIVANLDSLLDMIEKADMFAVISFRTGPGRSEFTFVRDEVGDWFDESYLDDSVWEDVAAQDAWADMWRYTAERYRDNPVVVGYDLMVEPNSEEVFLGLYDPEEFYPEYEGTTYDWNVFYPRVVSAVREVDSETPVLVSGMGYGAVRWLPYLEPTDDPRTVYIVHQYAPHDYTHQSPPAENGYPGSMDLDWDGEDDVFDSSWLEDYLEPVADFKGTHGAPVSVNEFGVVRWVPGAAEYMDDLMGIFEEHGMNHALWVWGPSWEPHAGNDAFEFRHGPDPENHADVSSELRDVIAGYWSRNTVRPSSFR